MNLGLLGANNIILLRIVTVDPITTYYNVETCPKNYHTDIITPYIYTKLLKLKYKQ